MVTMARKFLSFLGTNNYLPCTYFQGQHEKSKVRFVQQALAQIHCLEWNTEDQFVVFTTPESLRKNWEDNGHGEEKCHGLCQCLGVLHLPCQIRQVSIPDGKSEEEIWTIFNTVCNELADNDTVFLDITHALRSLPMLAMVVIQYMQVLRRVHLMGIYYGAFEVLGTIEQVKEMAVEDRRVPIFDLTAFAQLADWSIAIDRFLTAGNAEKIHELVKMKAIPAIKTGKDNTKDEAMAIKKLAKRLYDFTQAMTTCRGRAISKCASSLDKALDDCTQAGLVPPLVPLLDKIRERTAGFNVASEITDGIRAARWCLNHNLIQQSYTILQETAVSFFLNTASNSTVAKHPCENINSRAMVCGVATLLAQNKDISEFRLPDDQSMSLLQKIWSLLKTPKENYQNMDKLEQLRNDLNHAGMNKCPLPADKFQKDLGKAILWLEQLICHQKSNEQNPLQCCTPCRDFVLKVYD
jgi:CRISPR-associated Csx2 family protein